MINFKRTIKAPQTRILIMYQRILLSIFGILLLLVSCQTDTATNSTVETTVTEKKAPVKVPSFNRDSAYQFVADQVAFGPRVPNTPAHGEVKNYLIAKLEKFGATVIGQEFQAKAYTGELLNGTNVIGQYNPDNPNRIILAAHWDSRHIADHDPSEENQDEPVMGADDGASGVGVLLEVARQLQAQPIDFGVDIIFFDLEDYGDGGDDGTLESWCLGSQYWSKNMHRPNYDAKYGILLDMVGAAKARFTKDAISRQFAGNVMDKVWKLAQGMGYGNYFVNDNTGQLVDDHFFVNTIAKIPMIDILHRTSETRSQFVKHWHTVEDTIDKIDKRTLKAVGQVVLAVVYGEENGTL